MDTSVKNIAPTGRISAELPCVSCGFLLRGLSISGKCPECGEPIRSTLGATYLDDADYARTGLADYGTSLKFAIPALLGLLTWPILGPLAGVVIAGSSYLRVSALERLRRAGAFESLRLRAPLRFARGLALVAAIYGTIAGVALLHDALGRWTPWMSTPAAIAVVWLWTLLAWSEVLVATWLLRRAAALLEVGWLSHAARIIAFGLPMALAMSVFLVVMGPAFDLGPAGRIGLLGAAILFAWIPSAILGWTLGASLQQVAGVASELHWLASAGDGVIEPPASPPPDAGPARSIGAVPATATRPGSNRPPDAAPAHRAADDPIPLD